MSKQLREDVVRKGYVLPGLPHLLLAADQNPGWQKVRQAFQKVREDLESSDIDVIVVYSTFWPSVIGHQIQAREEPEWVHVDDQFHALGSIPYKMEIDSEFARELDRSCKDRKLHSRLIDYEGFPIDTGSVVVQQLINKDNRWPMVIVSSNVYADRAETVVYGKAVRDALEKQGKKAAAIVVSSLSNRMHTTHVDPKDDHFSSKKDHEWNLKYLEFLKEGRLEDVSQLSRQFHREARVPKVTAFKPFWWLSAVMGQNNLYAGEVYEYQPVMGTGAAVIGLTPANKAARDLEFDEDDPEAFAGERGVLGSNEDMSDSSGSDNPFSGANI
ncbi:MAG: hypothetical protein HRT45_08795 [Bdellovibrionales bacterium]|nr:hypothetical protein [Bdellovibrionales bacterium]